MQSFCFRYTRQVARLAALWLVLLTAAVAFADNSKISPDLLPLLSNTSNKVNVIVQYNSSQQQQCTGGGLRGGIVCTALNLVSVVVNWTLGLIDAVAETVLAGDVITLSNQSNVSYISLDRQVSATLDYTADAVNAPLAWSAGLDGTGVGIAIIDSGIYSHPDLTGANGQSRVVYWQGFIAGVQYDDYGH